MATREKPSQQGRSSPAKNKFKKHIFFKKCFPTCPKEGEGVSRDCTTLMHTHTRVHSLTHPSRMYRSITEPFLTEPKHSLRTPGTALGLPLNPICQSRRKLSSLQLQRCKLRYNFAKYDFQQPCKKASASP